MLEACGLKKVKEISGVTFQFNFSFRGLSIVDPPRRSQINTSVVNYNAGADVLHKYQSQWSEMHKLAEENAVKAQVITDK